MFRKLILVFVISLCALGISHAQKKKKGKSSVPETPVFALKSKMDSINYVLGVEIANNIKSQGMDSINMEAFSKGLNDVFKGNSLMVAKDQNMQLLSTYFQALYAKKTEANKAVGEKFLAENKTKEGVVTLPSGLQYKILKEGTGPKPAATDKVTTHYHGTLIDGTVFDSSVERGEPASFKLNEVIPGWTEALQLMPVGSKWKIFVPSNLAYGERGAGNDIGPHAALIFDVELLSIDKE